MTAALLISAVLLAAQPVEMYAVVIGHNGGLPALDGRPGLPSLNYADDDALRLARWFELVAVPGGVTVLTEADATTRSVLADAHLPLPNTSAPTRTNLQTALQALKAKLAARTDKRPTAVFLFYAGHGQAGRLLLQPETGAESAITGKELKLALLDVGADRVELFIDACRAQSLFLERGGPDLSAEIDALEAPNKRVGLGLLTASQTDKPAGEAASLGGGFFSHVLASGLAGAADVNGDERLTFGELAAFVAFNTERLMGQRPWFEPPHGDLSDVVVDLHGTNNLVLGAAIEGRVQVTQLSGAPWVAEFNKPAGRAWRLSLPAGRYRVSQARSLGTGPSAVIDVSTSKVTQLDALSDSSREVSARGEEAAWQRDAFQTPFTIEALAAFDAGFVSGRARSTPRSDRPWALSASYAVGAAPFALGGVEQGAEFGVRYHFAGPVIGARAAFGSTAFGPSAAVLRRFTGALTGGWRFEFSSARLGLTPALTAGFKTVWLTTTGRVAGDPVAPALGANVRVEFNPWERVSLFAEARLEASWVQLDAGPRTATLEPSALVGASVWF